MYFNYEEKEVIQFYKDIQEVYEWEDSKLRHNGIYITAINADIMNLHRRFDIGLVNTDEIKVTLRDDINLVINENTQWDGNYKKLNLQSSFENSEVQDSSEFEKELKKTAEWQTSDASVHISFSDCSYVLQTDSITETGVYSIGKIGTYDIIMFRSDFDNSILGESYSMVFGTKVITETVKKKTVERTVTDYDNIILMPIKITSTDCFAAEGKSYTLYR